MVFGVSHVLAIGRLLNLSVGSMTPILLYSDKLLSKLIEIPPGFSSAPNFYSLGGSCILFIFFPTALPGCQILVFSFV